MFQKHSSNARDRNAQYIIQLLQVNHNGCVSDNQCQEVPLSLMFIVFCQYVSLDNPDHSYISTANV